MAATSFRNVLFSMLRKGPNAVCRTNSFCTQRFKHSAALPDLDKTSHTKLGLRWELCAAVCLTRPPILTPHLTDLEKKYMQLLEAQEFERSVLSDWEMEKQRQTDIIKAIESGEGVEDANVKITNQDKEDEWESKYKAFALEADESEHDPDMRSLKRVMREPLTFVVKKKLGNDTLWMLPTAAIEEGETMRECADRTFTMHCPDSYEGRILSNAPSAYFKYKFPKEVRLKSPDDSVGAKVFFYTALLKSTDNPVPRELQNTNLPEEEIDTLKNNILDYAWVSKTELPSYLKPKYYAAVSKILW